MQHEYTINHVRGKTSSFLGSVPREGKLGFHVESSGCTIIVPYCWYEDGEIKELDKADKFVV